MNNKIIMRLVTFIGIMIFAFGATAAERFSCEARELVDVNILGTTSGLVGNELSEDLTIIIEGSVFIVERQNLAGYWRDKTEKGERLFLKILDTSKQNVILDMQWNQEYGKMSIDYKGIHLESVKLYCQFTTDK